MRLDFDDDQRAVREAVASALKSADADRLRRVWGRGYLDREYQALGAMGMLDLMAMPPGGAEHGAGTCVEACIVAEALGQHAALTPAVSSVVQAAGLVQRLAPSHAELADVLSARQNWAFAHLEAGRRADATPLARLTGSAGSLVLDGEKTIVEWLTVASRVVVTCVRDGQPALALVAASAPGVSVTPRLTSTGGQLARLRLSGVAVAEQDVLGVGATAAAAIEHALRRTWLVQAAYLTGIGERALQLTVAHAKVREQFGRPLGAFQAVKQALADRSIALTAARLMVYEIASQDGPDSSLELLATTKAWVAEAVSDAVRWAHEIHGGLGAVDDHEVTLLFRRALAESQLFGSPSELWQLAADRRALHGDRQPAGL
jgi:alkylation response protein AidB-like acyl-CoA dehydrogenase